MARLPRNPRLSLLRLEGRELPSTAPFTFVALPDTQYYSQSYPATFNAQTQWIKDQKVARNIVFAVQLGDIVNTGSNLTQWSRARAAMNILHGEVPYSVVLGNHDYDALNDHSTANNFLANFGPQTYAGMDWFGGASVDGRNQYQRFTGGGYEFLHMTLQWEPDSASLDWARSVLSANPGVPTIISTHAYLRDGSNTRSIAPTATSPAGQPGFHSGESIFQQFVRTTPQVFMVLNGHYSSADNEGHQVSANILGQPVFEMVTDYQTFQPSGDQNTGFLRYLRFDPAGNTITAYTYSPTRNEFLTDANSLFSFSVNFAERFSAQPVTRTVAFQEGVDHGHGPYFGTHDTELREASPATVLGSSTAPLTIQADAGSVDQTLLRFDGIVGRAGGQIPPGARILAAELVVDSVNAGAGAKLHRMIAPWSESSTWSSLGAGIQTNGSEAAPSAVSQVGYAELTPLAPISPQLRINVTADIQAWANGSPNRGWAMLPWVNGTDAWEFRSSEFASAGSRPKLVVTWVPAENTASYQQGVAGYTGASDGFISSADPTTPQFLSTSLTTDTDTVATPDPTAQRQTLLKFDGLFGNGLNRVPRNSSIRAAFLILTNPYRNTNAKGAGGTIHRMSMPWSSSATWAGSFGGNGIQPNGTEARSTEDFGTGWVDFGTHIFDATSSVRAWANGEANHGWALLPYFDESDGTVYDSSEAAIINNRPRLVILYDPPQPDPSTVKRLTSSFAGDFATTAARLIEEEDEASQGT